MSSANRLDLTSSINSNRLDLTYSPCRNISNHVLFLDYNIKYIYMKYKDGNYLWNYFISSSPNFNRSIIFKIRNNIPQLFSYVNNKVVEREDTVAELPNLASSTKAYNTATPKEMGWNKNQQTDQ